MISTLKSFEKCHTAITLYEKFMFDRINQTFQKLTLKIFLNEMKKKFFQHVFIIMFSFDNSWSLNLKHNFQKKNFEINLINQIVFFLIDSIFFIFRHSIFIWSFNSLNCVEIDSIAIDQNFQNRWCFDFRYEIDWIVVFVDLSNFDNFTFFVWLTKIHDVDHQSFFVDDF